VNPDSKANVRSVADAVTGAVEEQQPRFELFPLSGPVRVAVRAPTVNVISQSTKFAGASTPNGCGGVFVSIKPLAVPGDVAPEGVV
jgi:hypothetical protein